MKPKHSHHQHHPEGTFPLEATSVEDRYPELDEHEKAWKANPEIISSGRLLQLACVAEFEAPSARTLLRLGGNGV